jgi:hypothetical protein
MKRRGDELTTHGPFIQEGSLAYVWAASSEGNCNVAKLETHAVSVNGGIHS